MSNTFKTDVKIIAKKLGVSHQTVYDWKNGKYLPSISRLQALAKLEGLTVEKLIIKLTKSTR